MKLHKLIAAIEDVLSAEGRKRKERRKSLKHILKKLKKHERSLQEQEATESDPKLRTRLAQDIALAHAQRKKALHAIRDLKKRKKHPKLKSHPKPNPNPP